MLMVLSLTRQTINAKRSPYQKGTTIECPHVLFSLIALVHSLRGGNLRPIKHASELLRLCSLQAQPLGQPKRKQTRTGIGLKDLPYKHRLGHPPNSLTPARPFGALNAKNT